MDSINALGTGVTSHLKKVPDELKIHKNPQLKDQIGNSPVERSNASNKSQVCFIFHCQYCNKNSLLDYFFSF
jgi:hypothetical protein